MMEHRETPALPVMPLSVALVGQTVTFLGVDGGNGDEQGEGARDGDAVD